MPSSSKGSSSPQPRPTFVFDADFPEGITQQVLQEWITPLELIPWITIIPSVKSVPDEDFIVNAWQKGVDGIVTCNYGMLDVPETLAVIRQTKMTVVACHPKHNKTQYVTGILLMNLANIAFNFVKDQPQTWELKSPLTPLRAFQERVRTVERNCNCDIGQYQWPGKKLATTLHPNYP